VEFGEPRLDLRPEEAISTSTRTLLASLGVADPGVAKCTSIYSGNPSKIGS